MGEVWVAQEVCLIIVARENADAVLSVLLMGEVLPNSSPKI